MRPLTELLARLGQPFTVSADISALAISGITADSRKVASGSLFVALAGEKTDGAQFITQAKQHGAVAVLCGMESPVDESIVAIRVENPRLALAQLAAAFYDRQPETIVAVTGTDGKTSTAEFTRQLFALLGKKAASIGTLGTIGEGGKLLYPGSHTTPDPVELHRMLAEMAASGYTHVCMEASSHGLDQYRLHGVRLSAAAFTNLTRDHLDYHKTEEAYFAAKARLFSDFSIAAAVINSDDPRAETLKTICFDKRLSMYGMHDKIYDYWLGGPQDNCFIIKRVTPLPQGQNVTITFKLARRYLWGLITNCTPKTVELTLPLVGTFQVMNMLAAAGLVLSEREHSVEKVLGLLPKLKGIPGRLELVATLENGATVYVDYAHTPMALANILQTLRPHTQGKLHVVFGCGGDRDKGKRPEMGEAAERLADAVIVTDDNPRSEDPAAIRKAVLTASPRAKEVADRRQAIYVALQELRAGDILVIAGKGHEKTQIIGDRTLPFDDAQVAREAAKELKLAV
jgi:UDP-N-acetylmuramoyl-L-alanyl-D-glutamate--2,6-diaminopimelate ligase